jgi:hypothetical protein
MIPINFCNEVTDIGLSLGPQQVLMSYSADIYCWCPPFRSVYQGGCCRTLYGLSSFLVNRKSKVVPVVRSAIRTYSPMKMERTECSETLAFKLQTPGNNPKANIRHSKHGESLKTRKVVPIVTCVISYWDQHFFHRNKQVNNCRFWSVMPCVLIDNCLLFGGFYCVPFQPHRGRVSRLQGRGENFATVWRHFPEGSNPYSHQCETQNITRN